MARRNSFLGQAARARAGDMNPLIGVAASGAVGTGTAIGLRYTTAMDHRAELIGLGAGVLVGAGLMVSPRSRAAGLAGIVTAVLTNGLRALEAMVSEKQQIKDLQGSMLTKSKANLKETLAATKEAAKAAGILKGAGLGAVAAYRTTAFDGGLGMVQAERRSLAGGLGITSVDQVPTLSALGQGGLGAMAAYPTTAFSGADPVTFQGLANHYGANLFGGRN